MLKDVYKYIKICTWRYKWNLKQSAGINSNGQKRNNIIKVIQTTDILNPQFRYNNSDII